MWNNKPMLVLKCNYIKGQLDGVYNTWCAETGRPLIIANYKNGKDHGDYIQYYKINGNLNKKLKYHDGIKLSGSKTWYSDGKLKSEFIDNTLSVYDIDGKITDKFVYDNCYNLNNYIRTVYQYNLDGTIYQEQILKNSKLIHSTRHWKTNFDGSYENYDVCQVDDHTNKTIVMFKRDNPNFRIIYDFNGNLIRKEKLDMNGNIIPIMPEPSLWSRIQNYMCPKPNRSKYSKYQLEEEAELMNHKMD